MSSRTSMRKCGRRSGIRHQGTPLASMVARLNRELNEILREEAVWQKLQKAGITNEGGTPQALTAFIRAETQRVRAVVNKAVSTGTAG